MEDKNAKKVGPTVCVCLVRCASLCGRSPLGWEGTLEGVRECGYPGGGETRCAASGAAEICTALIATRADRERLLE